MATKYLPKQFESKWVSSWEKEEVYKTGKPDKKHAKAYALSMFPYPSAAGLHVGHVRIYTATDVLARYLRMKGKAVLHPMGWDAFGLPAENAAIAAEKNPMEMVPKNIKNFKQQMKMLGFSYDWEREFATTDPDYYKWTQWLFIQFFKMGLLYKKQTPVNFCPTCKTGLAEEEVLPDGTHERCGQPITRKELPQWLFRITSYADRLLDELEGLDWPKGILDMQRNWIGRSEGAEVEFKLLLGTTIECRTSEVKGKTSEVKTVDEITCFTTRPDTLFGVTAIVLAPEHPLVVKILNSKSQIPSFKRKEIKKYVKAARRKSELQRVDLEKEKTGVFTGLYCLNPVNGEKVPIWVADYVVGWYGYGAVMVVPGHDSRDYEFAQKFNLPIKVVILPSKESKYKVQPSPSRKAGSKLKFKIGNQWVEGAYTGEGVMINSGQFNNLPTGEGRKAVVKFLQKKGVGKAAVEYKIRDWIFSRQRYWGEPIPMVYCESCAKKGITFWHTAQINQKRSAHISSHQKPDKSDKPERPHRQNFPISDFADESRFKPDFSELVGWFPVPDDELPLKLPYLKSYQPMETGESPLAKIGSFVKTKCPNCGGGAKRETDTMPNWAGSCWYFIRFAQVRNSTHSASSGPSALSSGSKRLILSQVEGSKLKSDKKIKPPSVEQWNNLTMKEWLPVDWYLGGAEHAVLHLLYARFWVKALQDLKLLDFSEPFLKLCNVGMVLGEDSRKMSKSFGNVINPDGVVEEYGADTLRIYEMFMAPFSSEIAWSAQKVQGPYRFLARIWQIYHNSDKLTKEKNEEDKKLAAKLQKTIFKVSADITDVKFNTAIASMMKFLNEWEKKGEGTSEVKERGDGKTSEVKEEKGRLSVAQGKQFLKILAPFAPFITDEIWREVFGERKSIHLSGWPKVDEKALKEEMITLAVQVDGKLRGTVEILADEASNEKAMIGKARLLPKVKKYLEGRKYRVVYVVGRVVNFVVESDRATERRSN